MEADDIGSPGYTMNHVLRPYDPRLTSIARDVAGAHLTWKARPNKRYELQYKNALAEPRCRTLSEHTATGFSFTVLDATVDGVPHRFYRLHDLADAP